MPQKQPEQHAAPDRPAAGAKGLVVMNPEAGGGNGPQLQAQIREVLDEGACDFHEIREPDTLCETLRAAVAGGGYRWLAAAGGDGTVSLAGHCAVALDLPLGIIPAGTGNALAGAFGIPTDVTQAAALLKEGAATRRIDAIRIDGQHYFLQVGVGLEALAMEKTGGEAKGALGALAYAWTAAREAAGWEPQRFKLTVDGEDHDVEASELVLANTAGVGIFDLSWGPHIAPDDGIIDIVTVLARAPGDYLPILTAMRQGRQTDHEAIGYYRARRSIRVEAAQPLPTHADGEVFEGQWPVTAQVVPRALALLVPAAA